MSRRAVRSQNTDKTLDSVLFRTTCSDLQFPRRVWLSSRELCVVVVPDTTRGAGGVCFERNQRNETAAMWSGGSSPLLQLVRLNLIQTEFKTKPLDDYLCLISECVCCGDQIFLQGNATWLKPSINQFLFVHVETRVTCKICNGGRIFCRLTRNCIV